MNIGKERRTIVIEPIEEPVAPGDPAPSPGREHVPAPEPERAADPAPAGSTTR